MIFETKVIERKMRVLIFSTIPVRNIFRSRNNLARYDQKFILVFMSSTLYPSWILMKLDFSRQIFEKYSDLKFIENPLIGGRVVAFRQTEGRDETNNRFSQFCESVYQGFNTNSFLSSQPSRQSALTSPAPSPPPILPPPFPSPPPPASYSKILLRVISTLGLNLVIHRHIVSRFRESVELYLHLHSMPLGHGQRHL